MAATASLIYLIVRKTVIAVNVLPIKENFTSKVAKTDIKQNPPEAKIVSWIVSPSQSVAVIPWVQLRIQTLYTIAVNLGVIKVQDTKRPDAKPDFMTMKTELV